MKNAVFILLLFTVATLRAQEYNCRHNGCTVKVTGKYAIELAGCHNFLDIYVYDSKNRPLRNFEITGSAEFNYLEETSLTSTFAQYFKTNSLRAKIPAPGYYNCRITLNIEGELISAFFDNECELRANIDKHH